MAKIQGLHYDQFERPAYQAWSKCFYKTEASIRRSELKAARDARIEAYKEAQ
jgi:hypothetical protein